MTDEKKEAIIEEARLRYPNGVEYTCITTGKKCSIDWDNLDSSDGRNPIDGRTRIYWTDGNLYIWCTDQQVQGRGQVYSSKSKRWAKTDYVYNNIAKEWEELKLKLGI